MSSSGHYTRYINKYPGWFDGGDLMSMPLYNGDQELGHFRVEHNHENTWAWCEFLYGGYTGPSKRITIIDHEGKKAIQHILEYMQNTFDKEAFKKQRIQYGEV